MPLAGPHLNGVPRPHFAPRLLPCLPFRTSLVQQDHFLSVQALEQSRSLLMVIKRPQVLTQCLRLDQLFHLEAVEERWQERICWYGCAAREL